MRSCSWRSDEKIGRACLNLCRRGEEVSFRRRWHLETWALQYGSGSGEPKENLSPWGGNRSSSRLPGTRRQRCWIRGENERNRKGWEEKRGVSEPWEERKFDSGYRRSRALAAESPSSALPDRGTHTIKFPRGGPPVIGRQNARRQHAFQSFSGTRPREKRPRARTITAGEQSASPPQSALQLTIHGSFSPLFIIDDPL